MALTSMNTSFTFSETHREWGMPRRLVASAIAASHPSRETGSLSQDRRVV